MVAVLASFFAFENQFIQKIIATSFKSHEPRLLSLLCAITTIRNYMLKGNDMVGDAFGILNKILFAFKLNLVLTET